MSNTLIETFDGFLTPDLVGKMASVTGESSSSISKAISAAGSLVLGGLVERADEPAKMSQIMSLLTSPNSTNALDNLNSLVAAGLVTAGPAKSPIMEAGANFLSSIFGTRQIAVAAALSQYAGIKSTSASSLLGWVAPIVMGLLGDRVRKDGLSVASLSNWLASQRGQLTSLPTTLLSAAGLGGLLDTGDSRVMAARAATAEPRRSMRWLWPAAIALALLLGLSALLSRSPSIDVRAPAAADLGAFFTRRLPNGVTLNIPERGIENQVVGFIEATGQPLEPARWFNFDRLLFATNSAALEPQSREQLTNIAEIIKAYPSVQVKIGGYTDNTGSPEANMKLSQDRAASVRDELVRLGVAPGRVAAEGYGQQHPVADNSTEEGRAQNRRIALQVTQR